MNKKFYLAALGVSLAFAACTEEEIVNVPTSTVSFEDREKIELEITASKSDLSTTRMTVEESEENKGKFIYSYLWEKDVDKLGAGMADGPEMGNVPYESDFNQNVYITYPFTANSSAATSSFSGKSSIAQGVYFFHYPYHDHLGRVQLDLSIPVQKYDASLEAPAIEQAVKYMKMITPLVDFSTANKPGVTYNDAQKFALPLTFEKLYSVVGILVSSENIGEGVAPTIDKVTLSCADFPTSLKLNLGAFENKKAGFDKSNQKLFNDDVFAANSKDLHNKIYDKSIYTTTGSNGVITLNVDGVTLANGETDTLFVLVPKGSWSNVTMEVLTSEGKYTKLITTLNNGETGTGADDAAKNAQYAKRDAVRLVAAPLNFDMTGNGNIELPYDFTISSYDEWYAAEQFVLNHAAAYISGEEESINFILSANIEIPSLPVFAVNIESSNATNRVLTLASDYTVNQSNAARFTTNNVSLGVKAGATLTLGHNYTAFASVENHGTLNVNVNQTELDITNYGQMNVNADVIISEEIVNGHVKAGNSDPIPTYVGTITIAQGKELTAEINNANGTINLTAGVAATESAVADLTVWNATGVNAGTININASSKITGSITNNGTINHYGILAADVTNSRDIVINKGAVGDGTSEISGSGAAAKVTINDIVDFGEVMATEGGETDLSYTISDNKVTAVVNNYAEYASANAPTSNLTYITLAQGNWTLVSSATVEADGANKVFVDPIVDGIEYKGGILTLGTNLGSNVDFTGNATVVCAKDEDNNLITASITGSMTNIGDLVISENVTVNDDNSGNNYTAIILGNLTVKRNAAMYFNTATVAAGKTLSVEGEESKKEGNNKVVVKSPGIFGVKTLDQFINNGTVWALDGTGYNASVQGQVSQPKNSSTGTFKGNAATIPFIN